MGLTKQIGIMQGRLSPRIDGKIQAYPAKTWQKEFESAQEIGYSAIEWIVEGPLEKNALMSEPGIESINQLIIETGVKVEYVCADIFMQQPFVRVSDSTVEENKKYLNQILLNAKKIGAIGVEIPFVDASSIKSGVEEVELVSRLQEGFDLAGEIGMSISLETDLDANAFKELLERINLDHVKANYDIGNSASLGYDPIVELNAYGHKILNVHVKDRKLKGTTVPLGSGDANIKLVLSKLREIQYSGGITMQAARGEDDVLTAKEQLSYTLELLDEER
jgi:L-ribulose-5-phosphate 3-epimerase